MTGTDARLVEMGSNPQRVWVNTTSPRPEDCLAGGGQMGALMRSLDWSTTALGPVSSWPQSLRTTVSICLGTSFPMMIAWGPNLLMLYNDGYLPVLGTQKHPRALGQPLLECFAEIRDLIGPMFRGVMSSGLAVGAEDMMFPLERNGYTEETYFVFSYSPIRDESGVAGVLTTCTETTRRVIGERRLSTLRTLADAATQAHSADEAMRASAASFDPRDLPFALLYSLDADGQRARLTASSGLCEGGAARAATVALDEPSGAPWPFARMLASGGHPERVTELAALGDLSGRPWPEPAREALVLPIARPGHARPYGFLVAGVSPRRVLDDSYRSFFGLVADQLATAVANARARQEERRRAEALAELDRAKTAFFSNVSHEFRTPLTLMLGPLEDALAGARGPLAEPLRADLEATYRNALRLLKLVNTLLDFSRIEAGRAQAVYEPVDLAALTGELAGVFRSAIERAGLRFTVDCPPLPAPVYVDRQMWEKIVLNLLSNAFKFTFEGEIALSLRWREGLVELEVRDSGVGIPRDELPNLFKRFHRLKGARSRTHEGSGIGLALVQDLLRLHGGGIAATSEPGAGSAFKATVRAGTAHLPLDQIVGAPTQATSAISAAAFATEALRWLPDELRPRAMSPAREGPAPEDASPSVRATAGARILIADDNADMRDYLTRMLDRYWQVQAVPDGAAALERARARPPDLVLTDVMMPRLDGFALLRGLRADVRTRHVPVVMLSARAGEEARIEGLEAGADDYLIKPFSARELVARVASQLALAQARRAGEHERATLYSLFMQAPTPICILRGERHTIDLANPVCCEVWGREHGEVIGRPLFAAIPELESQVYKGLLDSVLDTGEPYIGKEMAAELGREGARRTIYFNFVYAPLRSLAGEIEGVLVIAFDVTDEIHARDELARTVRYNELFAGILAHDLRNPLGAMIMAAHLLLSRSTDDAITRPTRRIVSSGQRMGRMIDQLLDFTRARLGGGIALERAQLDLAELVRRMVGEVQESAPAWTVQIETIGDGNGQWDGDRLAQVVSNLAGNAIQHGSPEAPLLVRLDGREPDSVRLTLENRGSIPEQLLPVVFEPFRGSERKRSGSQGLGLGLFITKQIVEAHGGRIELSSSAAEGTRFSIVLPRSDVSPQANLDGPSAKGARP